MWIVIVDVSCGRDPTGNSHIGGSIPSNLPVTLQNIFLSANVFPAGSIPTSLSSLSQLSAMSLNGNHLTGEIPDSFQGLTTLVNLDLHLQNNQLSGTLDVLQDLPLADLNVENNLFSGPIPQKLFSIPNFKKDGNPFNSSIAPTSSTAPVPAPPVSGSPTSPQTPPSQSKPGKQADGPSAPEESSSTGRKKSLSSKRAVPASIPKPQDKQQVNVQTMSAMPKKDNSEINLSRLDIDLIPPPPPPPPPTLPQERVIVKPIAAAEDTARKPPPRPLPLTSVKSYTIASLQQYAIASLKIICWDQNAGNGTLQDALHSDNEFKRQLSWNTRIRMALGATEALDLEPPIIHRNFKSANLLLDDELAVHVSDCGLAPLISSGSGEPQRSPFPYKLGNGGDLLSGQLLTTYGYGRVSYDRTRSRGEQFLVSHYHLADIISLCSA
ncbi:hypothetical protein HAX54_048007 [Datura stramonium]|uniref:Serine-threonine/tyrosine-protein kinase catalytic domain-containing protein n=1 Tax=Datura stramonium TaxID=4076 RepID=A0ABS8STS2_DATST|nr:hypothetical protein [Datura stramonium]